jgi:ATP-dependent RNA helicase RhlE
LDQRIMSGIASEGFSIPTPIQQQTIPPALAGRDVLGLAQTGTGKTAAFVLPILQRILTGPKKKIRALIITPTRELAEQIHGVIRDLGAKTGIKSMTIYGGASMVPQLEKLRGGVEIVVACPGRLLDHIRQETIDLSHVQVLVLDEADRMLDMGFMPDIRSIMKHIPTQRQTLLFSATMPDEIRVLADRFMQSPEVVEINHSQPLKTVEHVLFPVEQHLKMQLLTRILREFESVSVLVFTRTKIRTRRIMEKLKAEGFSVAALQGDMPQSKRQQALQGFRDGKYHILVATDIAARGVDVLSISHVINFDMPDSPDTYTHRAGRTGRAERSGQAFTLVTPDDAPAVRTFERSMDVELHLRELDDFNYDSPAPASSGHDRKHHNHRRQPRGVPERGRAGARNASRGKAPSAGRPA